MPGSFHRTLQMLSVHSFGRIALHELLTETSDDFIDTHNPNQLSLESLKLDRYNCRSIFCNVSEGKTHV